MATTSISNAAAGGSSTLAATTTTAVAPSITLNPVSGQVGLTVQVSGSGFLTADTSCSLSGSPMGSSVCSISGGTLTASFVVANVAHGQYVIQVTGNQGDFAQAVFTVTSSGSIQLSPASGAVGTHVTVTGAGFSTSDTSCILSATLASSTTCSIGTYSGSFDGTYSGSFVVGNVPQGEYSIKVTGSPIGDSVSATFTVTAVTTTIAPSIVLNPTSTQVGATVQVSGWGFSPSDTSCSLSGSAVSTSTCTISGGTLTASFVVANVQKAGSYNVLAMSSPSGDSVLAYITVSAVSVTRSITLNPSSAHAGSIILVSGSGFSFSDTTCLLSGSGIASQTCRISGGTLTASFVVANVAGGSYTISVIGSTGDSALASLTVNAVITSSQSTQAGGNLITRVTLGSGSVSPYCPNGCTYKVGQQITVSAIPNSGWQFSSWSINGASCTNALSATSCTFTMPSGNVIVSVHFVIRSASWTFMVFMNGNNNLELGLQQLDLVPMETIGSTSEVNVVTLFARSSTNDAQVYYVGQGSLTTLADWGPTDMGNPQSLQKFITYVATNYPAQHYALVLDDHGGGFQGISYDSIRDDVISISGLKTALSKSGIHFDVIAFDACLMAMVEVAYQIRGYGDYMVASEEEGYVGAWNYQAVLRDLVNNPQMSGRELAIDAVQKYSQSPVLQGVTSGTDSAIDLSQMNNVASAVSNFATLLTNDLRTYKNQVRTARSQTDSYYFTKEYYVDLYDFASLIQNSGISDVNLKSASVKVMNAVKTAVIFEWHGTLHSHSHGLSIYFDTSALSYVKITSFYGYFAANLDFVSQTSWNTFLEAYVI
jgi:hypothetical protein